MELQNIDPYSFENFNKYLLAMSIDSIAELSNYCSLEINGKFYILGKSENRVVIVENDNGFLNSYEVELDDNGDIKSLYTEEDSYLFKRPGYEAFVQRKDNLSCNVFNLSLVKRDNMESYLEYRQFIENSFTVFIERYQTMLNSTNLSSAVAFTNYHLPTHLELHEVCGNNIFSYEKIKFYYLTEDAKNYRRAYIVRDRSYHLSSLNVYDGEKLINLIHDTYGLKNEIDFSLKSYAMGQHEQYNKIYKLVNLYQNYIINHK